MAFQIEMIKRINKVSALVLCWLFFLNPALAASSTNDGEGGTEYDSLRLFIDLASYRYEEPSLMSKRASSPFIGVGIVGSFDTRLTQVIYAAKGSVGKTDYSGSGTTSEDPTYIFDIDAKIPYLTPLGNISVGLGYRYLYDDWGSQTTSTGQQAFDRVSKYAYGLVGLDAQLSETISVELVYKPLLIGTQQLKLSGIGSYKNTSMHQNSGYGLDALVRFRDNTAVSFRYWDIGKSKLDKANGLLVEPPNSTWQIALSYYF